MTPPEGTFWIGSDHPFDLHECYLDFCAELDVASPTATAELHVSADSRYKLWINDRFVGRGPERSWPASMAVDRRVITGLLRAGCNRIHVQLYSPGYSHFAHVHRAACGLICWLSLDGKTVLTSGRHWRVRRNHSWSPLVRRVSIYGTGVEERDLTRLGGQGGDDPAGWAFARIVQPAEGPVWGSLRPRTTPLLSEEQRILRAPVETRFGPLHAPDPSAADDPHVGLRDAFAALPVAAVPPVLPAGHSAIWVFDLGESRVCVAGATLTAAEGDDLTISYAEKWRDGRLQISDPATYCRMRPTDRTVLRDGRQEVEGFTLRGGRFVVFLLHSRTGATPDPQFHVRLPSYPLSVREPPPESNPDLAAAAALCRRTTLACLQDGFVDSVWRESSQWLGDVVAQCFALAALSEDARPLRLAIDLAAEGAAADGILPSVLPGDVPAYVVTDYNFSWIELLDAWSRHPGRDEDLPRKHWRVLCRVLDRIEADCDAEGLIRSQPGRRLFLDWSPMDRAEPNLTYNLRYLHALNLAVGLARAANETRAREWSERARRLCTAIRARLLGPSGWLENPDGAPASQLALALLILADVVPPQEAATLADAIIARSMDPDDSHVPGRLVLASPFMHHYVFQALHRLGRDAEIRRIIALRWGRWAARGEPTAWENWDIGFPDGSACHGFSAHPLGWLALTAR